jgi:hypothetical protein
VLELYFLNLRAKSKGGGFGGPLLTREDGRLLDEGNLLALGSAPPLTFVIHGFNNDREEGRRGLSSFVGLLRSAHPQLTGRMVAVLWPGDSLLGPLAYPVQERDARSCAERIEHLCRVRWRLRESPSFVAHSLGCLVVLETMRRLHGSVGTTYAVLMAGAVDCDALARSDRYRAAVAAARGVGVLHSRRDDVLRLAFPLGDAIAAGLFGGYTRRALGRVGPKAAREPVENVPQPPVCDRQVANNHGDYLWDARAARFAGDLFNGASPPGY